MSASEWLTIDGFTFPVLSNTWKQKPDKPGSRKRTETGELRSVRLGDPVSTFTGQTVFATREAADTVYDLLQTYGDHEIEGLLPGLLIVCETDCDLVEALDDWPSNGGRSAAWRLSWTLTETEPNSGSS